MNVADEKLLAYSAVLYDPVQSTDQKIQVLHALAHRADTAAYELLQAYANHPDPGLSEIADTALMECGFFLHGAVCNDEDEGPDLIYTGLGPQKNLLRYYTILIHEERKSFTDAEREVIETIIFNKVEASGGIIENVTHTEEYAGFQLLLPAHIVLGKYIDSIIIPCNEAQVSVNESYYLCSGVPTPEEIPDILAIIRGEKEAPKDPWEGEQPWE